LIGQCLGAGRLRGKRDIREREVPFRLELVRELETRRIAGLVALDDGNVISRVARFLEETREKGAADSDEADNGDDSEQEEFLMKTHPKPKARHNG
jgi:hypothetical protein